ncbi:MAG: Calx-beta domain-containing protein [Thermoleophilaceae bacterium]
MTLKKILPLVALLALVLPGQAFATAKSKVRLSGLPYAVHESAGSIDIAITRVPKNGKSTGPLSNGASVYLDTTAGTAQAGTDYTAPTRQVVIFPGCTSIPAPASAQCVTQHVSIAVHDDGIYSSTPKSFTVSLRQKSGGSAIPVSPYSAPVFLLEDDPAPSGDPVQPTFFLYQQSTAIAENDPNGYVSAYVVRSDNLTAAAHASVVTADGPAQTGHGTAVAGTNYTAVPSTSLTFDPTLAGYSPVREIQVPVLDDHVVNNPPLDDFSVLLSSSDGAVLSGRGQEAVTIINADAPNNGPAARFVFVPASYSVAEGRTLEASVWATGSVATGTSVPYATSDGTAVAGTDYVAETGSLDFDSPDVEPIDIDTIDNSLANQADRTFGIGLTAPAGATVGSNAGVTITEDDPQPVASVGGVTVVRNGDGSITVSGTVTLSGPSATDVTVSFQIIDPATGAVLGTGTVTIPAGQTTGTFTITLTAGQVGDTQTIIVTLTGNGTNGATIPAASNSSSPAAVPAAAGSGAAGGGDAGGQVVLGARQSACGLVVKAAKKQKLLKKNALLLTLRTGRACKVSLSATLKQVKAKSNRRQSQIARALRLKSKKTSLTLQPGKAKTVTVKFTKKTLKAIKKALRARSKPLVATVTVTELDASSVSKRRTVKITIRR